MSGYVNAGEAEHVQSMSPRATSSYWRRPPGPEATSGEADAALEQSPDSMELQDRTISSQGLLGGASGSGSGSGSGGHAAGTSARASPSLLAAWAEPPIYGSAAMNRGVGSSADLYAAGPPSLGPRTASYDPSFYPLAISPGELEDGSLATHGEGDADTEAHAGYIASGDARRPTRRGSAEITANALHEPVLLHRAKTRFAQVGAELRRASHRVAGLAPDEQGQGARHASASAMAGMQRLPEDEVYNHQTAHGLRARSESDDEGDDEEEMNDERARPPLPTQQFVDEQDSAARGKGVARLDISLLRGRSLGIFSNTNPIRRAMTSLLSHW